MTSLRFPRAAPFGCRRACLSRVLSFFVFGICLSWGNSQLFGENEVVSCNEVYSIEDALNGTIQTLGYPDAYPERRLCKILLQGKATHRIVLRFEDFYLFHPFGPGHKKHASCDGLDTLHIYDGQDENSKLLGEYCGGRRPPPLMSSGEHLFLELTSYTSGYEAKGYSAKYYFVSNFGVNSGKQMGEGVCEFEYDSDRETEGNFSSPNPGGIYPTNTNCTYIFYGTFLERVHLIFHYFDLEGIEPCTARSGSDFLEFSNSPNFDPLPARRCGRFIPQEVVSEGSYFRITFRSNDRLNGEGFFASYKFVTDEELPKWARYLRGSAGQIAVPKISFICFPWDVLLLILLQLIFLS